MFGKKRKLEIRIVEDRKVEDAPTIVETPVDFVAVTHEAIKRVVIGVCVIIATSIILEAAAQIAINELDANKHDV